MTAAASRFFVRAALGALLTSSLVVAASPPAAADTSPNLLKNPNAELAPTGTTGSDIDVPMWDDRNGATTAAYGGVRYLPSSTSPGPANRGKTFFYGGPAGDSEFVQAPDITSYRTKIKAGGVKVNVVAWLGGVGDDLDRCDLEVRLVDVNDSQILKKVTLAGPSASERGNVTKLVKRAKTVLVPSGTHFLGVSIKCDRVLSAGSNNGLADNLVVKLLNV